MTCYPIVKGVIVGFAVVSGFPAPLPAQEFRSKGDTTLTAALSPEALNRLGLPIIDPGETSSSDDRGLTMTLAMKVRSHPGSAVNAGQRANSQDNVSSQSGGGASRAIGGDLTSCQLYDLGQFGREADIVGLAISYTAWNIGSADLIWFGVPDNNHPFMAMDLFRLRTVDQNERFEQIGQSWIKHLPYALNNTRCGGSCTLEPGHSVGSWLGMGCTDTYGAGLNAGQNGLGPRFEVNPWTGDWSYQGSHFQTDGPSHDHISHRLQVHDVDLDPAQNAGATYYGSTVYVSLDDVNAMNNGGWKPVTVTGSPGGTWSFEMSGSEVMPEIGFAIDAWRGTIKTVLAQEIPVIEFESPDGRCILAAKATDLGGGTWHYEYALLNVDMDRQVGSFSVPIGPDTTVTNVGFHAVEHHDEPFNTTDPDAVPIDNAPWDGQVTDNAVTWSTTSNPLRWGTLYNFRFDADDDPETTTVTVGLFRPGEPETLGGITVGPHPQAQSLMSFVDFQSCFSGAADAGAGCDRFDYEPDGDVDLDDYRAYIEAFTGP